MSRTNGAWLALGVAGAVAAAGAVAGRRGSGNRRVSSLTDEQLALLLGVMEGTTTEAQQKRLAAQGVDVQSYYDEVELLRELNRRRAAFISKYLPAARGTGADWSVNAWSVDNDNPREGFKGERFIVEDEDGDWSLVRRFTRDEEDEIEDLKRFRSFDELKKWLEKNATSRT